MNQRDAILILDFGSQVTQLIARRIREAKVYCEIHPHDVSEDFLKDLFNNQSIKGIILSGGPNSVYEEAALTASSMIFELGVPILGICYGMQWLNQHLGGQVHAATHREFGHANIEILHDCPLFNGITTQGGRKLHVWMSHGDHVTALAPGFTVLASTPSCPIAAMGNAQRHIYGIQFHPEVTHTPDGQAMLDNFVRGICQAAPNWTMHNYIDEAMDKIRSQVGGEEVILGLSGGVDSSVAAALIAKAIGSQLTCVFVDHGLLRLNEAQQVMETFANHLGVKVVHVNAKDSFMQALAHQSDPEMKRKIIGKAFVDVFQAESQKLTQAKWLAQGTIYPDVIESAGAKTNKAHKIKSHHNVGGLPEDLSLKLLEPLRELFKDEVRQLGLELGLPREMVFRHPFPGPGLAVRILGEIKPEYVTLLQKADAIFIEELRNTVDPTTEKSWYDLTSQAFVVFLPVKTVGVMGDGRTYDYAVALRAVITTDFMTAHWAHLPYDLLGNVANRIINEVPGINRVTYDISGKPPATIEWE